MKRSGRPVGKRSWLWIGVALTAAACAENPQLGDTNLAPLEDTTAYVRTPNGLYHPSCVYEVESGARFDAVNSRVVHVDGTVTAIPDCPFAARAHRAVEESRTLHEPTLNGWIEDVNYYNPVQGDWFGKLMANWSVPASPTLSYTSGQTLYSFPGLVSTQYIIQPVLQYSQTGNNAWTLASWHCNTGSNCIHSTFVNSASGDSISGSVTSSACNASGNCTWTITTTDTTNGQTTTLSVTDTELYSQAVGAALEVYSLNSCANLPKSGVFFQNVSVFDQYGSPVTPTWSDSVSGDTPNCGWGALGNGSEANVYSNFTRAVGDYDGDGKSDFALWRSSTRTITVHTQEGGNPSETLGLYQIDIPVSGHFDGGFASDFEVWDPLGGGWYGTGNPQTLGMNGDIPAPGDFDGDGKTDFAVFRPSNGTWYVLQSSTGTTVTRTWGTSGDIPAVGDFDGDGKSDYAVWRPSSTTFFVQRASGGTANYYFTGATSTDIPVVGDYDGDGKSDYALWRAGSQAYFYVVPSKTGTLVTIPWGTTNDIPVPGDYDADGKTDYAVWRPSSTTFFVTKSTGGGLSYYFTGATSSDTPVLRTTGL